MLGFVVRVDWVVCGDIAGRAGVAGQGIGSGIEDLVGETLDRLIDALEDIWPGWGYGQDRCNR